MNKRQRALQATFLAALATAPATLRAQVSGSWINPGSGTWTDVVNWDSQPQFPDAGGTVSFGTRDGPVTITLNSGITLSSLHFDSPDAYVTTGSGSIILIGPALLSAVGPDLHTDGLYHRISVPVGGSDPVSKTGSGTLILGSATYTGATTISAGTLILGNLAFGSAAATITLDHGALGLTGAGANRTINSPIESHGVGTLIPTVTNGRMVSLLAPIGGNGTLYLGRAPFTGGSGSMSVQADSPFSGALVIGVPLQLTGSAAFPNVTSIETWATLTINNDSPTGTLDRVGNNAPVALNGSAIVMTSSGAAVTATEQIGTVTLAGGFGTLSGTDIARLATPRIVRADRSILSLGSGTPSSGAFVQVTSVLPTLSGSGPENTPQVGVIPWASTWDLTPITEGTGGFLRPLNASEFINAVPTGVTASNLFLSQDATMSQSATVNSLTIRSGVLSGSSTLTVTSGLVVVGDQSQSTQLPLQTVAVPLDFQTAEGIIRTRGGAISGAISGTGGLTVVGGVRLSGANTYTGVTWLSGVAEISGSVLLGVPGPLGLDSSPVVVRNGLTFTGGPTIRFERDLDLEGTFPGISTGASGMTLQFPGAIQVNATGPSVNSANGTFEFSGPISGAGRLFLIGGTVSLSGDNSGLAGGMDLSSGTFIIGSNTAFGSATLSTTGTLIATGGPRVFANSLAPSGNITFSGSEAMTFAGPVDMAGGLGSTQLKTLTAAGATVTLSGTVFRGSMTKSGPALLQIGTANLSSLSITQGPLRFLPGGSTANRITSLSISAGATMDLTDNALVLDYTGATPLTSIRTMLSDGRLNSSFADATHGLAYAENSVLGRGSFAAVAVDSSSILMDLTYFGDSNLDSDVDADDLGALASHWQSMNQFWSGGDFNYDGSVDIKDLYLLASNWGAGTGAPPSVPLSEALASLGLPIVEVPEAGTLTTLSLCLSVAATRRRRAV